MLETRAQCVFVTLSSPQTGAEAAAGFATNGPLVLKDLVETGYIILQ